MLYSIKFKKKESTKTVIKGENLSCKCTHNSYYNVFDGKKVGLFNIRSYILAQLFSFG
jgi:hypothetical protein